jgi:23S rRNA pseudouridine955/2504/2580 synthase
MLRKKNITLNGKKAEGKEILAQGDEVKCFFSEETYASMPVPGQRKILPITVRLTVL